MEIKEIRKGRWMASLKLLIVLLIGGIAGSGLTAKTGRAPFGVGNTIPMWIAAASPVQAGQVSLLQASAKTELKNLEQAGESAKAKPSVRNRIDMALPLIEEKITVMNTAYDAKEYLRARMADQEALRYIQELQKRLALTY